MSTRCSPSSCRPTSSSSPITDLPDLSARGCHLHRPIGDIWPGAPHRAARLPGWHDRPVTPAVPIEPVLEILAVFVGALSGGLAAVRKQFDVFGVLVLAWAAGLGGGVLRDVLIGATPPVGIADWRLIAAACLGGAVMYLFHPGLQRARRMIAVLDAGALALFTVAGTIKGAELGAGPVAAVCVGGLTGVGGGVLRDLLTGEVPAVL